jgi:hypothetical protein
MIRALMMFLLTISLLAYLTSNITVNIVSTYNLSAGNVSSLEMLENISTIAEDAQNTLNATTPSSTTMLGFDLGGIWTTITKFINTPSIISSVIAGVASLFGISVPGLAAIINTFSLVLVLLLLFGIINFVRSGKEL